MDGCSEKYMAMALEEAKLALMEGEVAVGAIVVRDDVVVGRGHNDKEATHLIEGHAEIRALGEASKRLGRTDLSDCVIYVTLEPCLMCAGAILSSRIKAIYYGADDVEEGAIKGRYHVYDDNRCPHHPLVYSGVLKKECEDILKESFLRIRKKD